MIDSTNPIMVGKSTFTHLTAEAVAVADSYARVGLQALPAPAGAALIHTELHAYPDGTFAVIARWVPPQDSLRDKALARIGEALRHDENPTQALGWAQLICTMELAGIR